MAKRTTRKKRRTSTAGWLRRIFGYAMVIAMIGGIVVGIVAWSRSHPEDAPWTRLDLADPVGLFTGRKLAALTGDAPLCRELLDRAGVKFTSVKPFGSGQCHYADGLQLAAGGAREIGMRPVKPIMACPVAAGLSLWEWNVVQPAARRHLGAHVTAFDQLGTYNCRRIGGRSAWSEHATADAIDIAGFRLDDGRHIMVAADWNGDADRAAFLREVRDGACGLFSSVLSPDYNAAHRDHFHLDQAARGEKGWRACH